MSRLDGQSVHPCHPGVLVRPPLIVLLIVRIIVRIIVLLIVRVTMPVLVKLTATRLLEPVYQGPRARSRPFFCDRVK